LKSEKSGSTAFRAETSDDESSKIMKVYEQQSPYYQGETGQTDQRPVMGKGAKMDVIQKFNLDVEKHQTADNVTDISKKQREGNKTLP
jgi:hypothetical protein